jgi:hypothetical protein
MGRFCNKIMSEIASNPEIKKEHVELNSALITYFVSAALFASSEGFENDVMTGAFIINRGDTHWYNEKLITDEVRRAYAASTILVQLCRDFNQDDQEIDSPVLTPVITTQLDFYLATQEKIDDIGISFRKENIDIELIRQTVRTMDGRDVAPNQYSAAAAAQWAKRGNLELEMIDLDDFAKPEYQTDYSQTAPDKYYEVDGIMISEYPLPDTPVTRQTVPYYKKFHDESQGEEWLDSILEDLQEIKQG